MWDFACVAICCSMWASYRTVFSLFLTLSFPLDDVGKYKK